MRQIHRPAGGNNFAAGFAAFRTKLHHPISLFDNFQIVLDNHHRVPGVYQPLQNPQQRCHVVERTCDPPELDRFTRADPAPDRYRIFVTSAQYTGLFFGLAGADAKCAAIATTRGLEGVYKAWLSGVLENALDRIKGNGPWYRMNSTTVIFGSRASIIGGPPLPVGSDEEGKAVLGGLIWTGTSATGVGTGATCENWGSTFAVGTVGVSDRVGASWTEGPMGTLPCNSSAHLICLRAD